MKLLQLALDSLRARRFAEAEARFHKVLAYDPANATALHQLGLFASDRGQHSVAREFFEKAVQAEPENLQSLVAYGQLLHDMSDPREALDVFLRVLSLQSSYAEVWNAAGICFQETAQPAKAIEFYLRAIALQPSYAEAYNNLGVVLSREGDVEGAIEHFREALAIYREFADCHSNLGVVLRERFRYMEAIACFREAARLKPDNAEYAGCLGEALGLIYDDAAERELRRGVELCPDDPEKHWNLAVELLKRGDYHAGWLEYEWRWQRTRDQTPLPSFEQPYWRGEPGQTLRDTTILLHAEQGLGDTLQFLRYVPILLAQSAHVLLEVQPALRNLAAAYAQQMPGKITVLDGVEPRPAFDWHAPLMSLPLACGTTLDNVPPPRRFTSPAPERSRHAGTTPLRVGLAWAGNAAHVRDRERSIPIEALLPLFEETGVSWVSLQTGPAAMQIANAGISIEQPPLHDFLDTAAVIDMLDLVIAVDTAVAHLAPSQGAQTWILLPFVADWRWLRQAEESESSRNPWYPEARIFRQSEVPAGHSQRELWKPVIENVTRALRSVVQSRSPAEAAAGPSPGL